MSLWHVVQETAGAAAGILSLAAFIPYAIHAIRDPNTRPHRATWWIWTVVGCMIAATNYSAGVRAGIWLPISYILGPAVLAVISLKHGEGGWTRLDRFCIVTAILSAIVWWLTTNLLTALLINIAIDLLGAIPTLRKSYREPEQEDPVYWYLAFGATSLNMLAIEQWSFSHIAYPVYLFLLVGTISFFELRPHLRKKTHHA